MDPKKLLIISAALMVIGLAGSCLGMLSVLGHSLVTYTVINETDIELVTWGMTGDCSTLADDRGDYTHEEVVPAGQSFEYRAYGPQVWADCIHVATIDRRIVVIEEYHENAVVGVARPLVEVGQPVPKRADLPRKTAWEYFVTESPGFLRIIEAALLVLGIGIGGSLLSGAIWWKRRRS